MVVYVDDAEPVYVEQLTLEEARLVLARAEAELQKAYNAAHAASLQYEIAEILEQIEWLEGRGAGCGASRCCRRPCHRPVGWS